MAYHRKKQLALAVFICCIVFGMYALQNGWIMKASSLLGERGLREGSLRNKARNRKWRYYKGLFSSTSTTKLTKKLPSALIIGVKKGGTRALLTFIRLHPDVMCPGNEVHFFDKHYDLGMEWYRSQMPPSRKKQITLEKSPGYFPDPDVPKRVYKMNKDIKLIVVFREPVSRSISDYTQSLSKDEPKTAPFSEQAMLDYKRGVVNPSWSPISISLYADHLRNWLAYFPLNQFVFLDGDNLVQHPAEELIKLQKFLKLDVVVDEDYFYFNETKGFPCLKYGKKGTKEKMGKKRTKEDTEWCFNDSKGRDHPSVDRFTIKQLQRFFKPYNKHLYHMTGINFNWENTKPKK